MGDDFQRLAHREMRRPRGGQVVDGEAELDGVDASQDQIARAFRQGVHAAEMALAIRIRRRNSNGTFQNELRCSLQASEWIA